MNLRPACAVFLGLLALVELASAARAAEPGFYVGASAGRAGLNLDAARINNSLIGGGLSTQGISTSNRDTGYKLYGGFDFSRNLALEAGFFDLGRYSFTSNTAPPGSLRGDIRIRGLNLDVLGSVPISGNFSAFGRLGLNYAQTSDSFVGSGAVGPVNSSPSKRDTNGHFGLGLAYAFSDSLGLRLEAERYLVNDGTGNNSRVDLFSLGLVYRFGAKSQGGLARSFGSPTEALAGTAR